MHHHTPTAAHAARPRRIVDLTHTLDEDFPLWPGDPLFRMRRIREAPEFLVHELCFGEHTGTHVDAPLHCVPGGDAVDRIRVDDLLAPLVLVDIADRTASDPDALATPADLAAWESLHGRIPDGALVALITRPARGRPDGKVNPEAPAQPHDDAEVHALTRSLTPDAAGIAHWPGFSREAAEFLVQRRAVVAIGTDAPSIDCGASTAFPAHHAVLGAGRYAVEMLAALRALPPAGATAVVAPLKHRGGSGGPARVLALLD
ncbi:cyclase family protein [Tomitella fengzijianii]|uniref:Cyclase family protein n=2 Tax=Tomitella fengzijianii TaxID=2597660 RepID=A0A516X7R6_9ACTN|nr:cyclase family protein [Tomitella fengzijianii]